MCEIAKGQRRTFRDQDPPRICKRNDSLKNDLELSKSTPNSPTATILQPSSNLSSLEKCFSEPGFFEKDRENREPEKGESTDRESASFNRVEDDSVKEAGTVERTDTRSRASTENFFKELADKVPSSKRHDDGVSDTNLSLYNSLLRLNIWHVCSSKFSRYISFLYFFNRKGKRGKRVGKTLTICEIANGNILN